MKPLLINLDLKINNYAELELKQGCNDVVIATITDLGEVVDLTGQVISVEMLKADNTFIIQNNDIVVLNNKITIKLNKDLTRVSGKGKLQIKMTKDNVITGSWVIDVKIKKGAIDDAVGESGNIVTIIETLENNVALAVAENAKTENLIATGGAATKGELAETNSQLADIVTQLKINVKDYGAKGDGITDDTNSLERCWDFCTDNGHTMYFPNGVYIQNKLFKKSNNPLTDPNADLPIYIVGESAFGVKINTTNGTTPIYDVSCSKTVYMSNIMSDNTWFHCKQGGDDEAKFSKVRDVQLYNVLSLSKTHSYPSWNMFINTPAPKNYNIEENDSRYNRYPIEILSNSGYNPIMIENFANTNEDGTHSNPSDNSSIGITDRVANSTGVILISCPTRANYQVQNYLAESISSARMNVVHEIDELGRVSIGCSTQSSDTVAPGNALIKARGKYPRIALYDHNRSNRRSYFAMSDDLTQITSLNEGGEVKAAIYMDYKKGSVSFKGKVIIGNLLTWSGNSAVLTGGGLTSVFIPPGIISRLENVIEGVEGQTINIVSEGSLTIEHNKEGWGNIRTNTKQNVILEKGNLYILSCVNGLWYLK